MFEMVQLVAIRVVYDSGHMDVERYFVFDASRAPGLHVRHHRRRLPRCRRPPLPRAPAGC